MKITGGRGRYRRRSAGCGNNGVPAGVPVGLRAGDEPARSEKTLSRGPSRVSSSIAPRPPVPPSRFRLAKEASSSELPSRCLHRHSGARRDPHVATRPPSSRVHSVLIIIFKNSLSQSNVLINISMLSSRFLLLYHLEMIISTQFVA